MRDSTIGRRIFFNCLALGVVATLWCGAALAGGLGEANPELWVDGPLVVKPGNDPRFPAATADHRGRQIFVWDSNGNGTGLDIYLRIFERDGTALFDPVLVNTLVDGNQLFPQVAAAADGTFLVIWQSYEPPNPGDNFQRVIIRSQAFDADGQAQGSEQVLSELQTLIATTAEANVTALTGGGYVAVWESFQSANPADTSYSIQGRLVGPGGFPTIGQFQVNSLMTGTLESDPDVTALADGGFFVTWANPQIHGRRFNLNAAPQGDDIQINTFDSLQSRDDTSVATRDNGDVLVVWTDREDGVTGSEIRGRLYDPQVNPLGADFRINTFADDAQNDPSVAGYGDGFFVIWQSIGSTGPDLDPRSIEGRIVSGVNAFSSTQFLVNEYTTQSQENPDIGGRDGIVAMAWLSRRNEVTAENVILGQTWNVCGIFCDSFE